MVGTARNSSVIRSKHVMDVKQQTKSSDNRPRRTNFDNLFKIDFNIILPPTLRSRKRPFNSGFPTRITPPPLTTTTTTTTSSTVALQPHHSHYPRLITLRHKLLCLRIFHLRCRATESFRLHFLHCKSPSYRKCDKQGPLQLNTRANFRSIQWKPSFSLFWPGVSDVLGFSYVLILFNDPVSVESDVERKTKL
jgi:hypothetical protein